ncbi:SAF domain-containing protein [Mucilaginibacter yixingensis]|uniref:SAF domain-containing protein n=1 Tax=Mucilaginibacter yixingensis TaxID=1295612 RepID=A0A2T5JGK7_9SPHI|nr:UxaA family hydrolase [Mucilaginibacter yixingensis]PTR01531.1 SAF domain-containing protein [Mucilaginibacter yixingensis]
MTEKDSNTIHLHASDNVVACKKTLMEGSTILIMNKPVVIAVTVGIGHKLACKDIARGEIIFKYGVPIGKATEYIPFGSHVHTHNIESNYIPTYLID